MATPVSSYPSVLLGDVCRFIGGGTPSRKREDYYNGNIPWATVKDFKTYRITDTEDHISEASLADSASNLIPPGTVLLVTRVGLGKVAITGRQVAINQDIKAVIPSTEILPDFLFWFLLSKGPEIQRMGTGATVKGVTLNDVRSISMPLPPLAEQQRIVDILSRAEGIVRLRREAQKKAAEIIPALFIDMFGDPATNPKGWPLRKVSDFVTRFEGGKNIQAGSETGSDYRILKVSAVTSGTYRESESKPAPDGYQAPSHHIVKPGDMLFSRANTEELVGATAIVHQTNGKTLLPDKLWRFIWSESVEPQYMLALFQSAHVRRELGQLSSGTSASMRNISQAKLFEYLLPIAPLADQKKFAELATGFLSIKNQQISALEKAGATFNSLLTSFFN